MLYYATLVSISYRMEILALSNVISKAFVSILIYLSVLSVVSSYF